MEAQRMTITEFLTARLDEDEGVAREVQAKTQASVGRHYEDAEGSSASAYFDSEYLQGGYTITAVRALADIASKRAIVALHVPVDYTPLGMDSPNACEICGADLRMGDWEWVKDSYPCQTVRLLASLYESHKDYAPSWRVG